MRILPLRSRLTRARWWLAPAAAACLAAAAGAAAAERQARWGNLLYEVPDGVEPRTRRLGGERVVHLRDGDDATADLRLLGGRLGGKAAAEAWLRGRLDALCGGEAAPVAAPAWQPRPGGGELGVWAARALDRRGRTTRAVVVGALLTPTPGSEAGDASASGGASGGGGGGGGGRFDAVGVVLEVERGAEPAELAPRLQDAFARVLGFLSAAKPVGRRVPLLPPAEPGPLSGFYWGSSMRVSPVYGGGLNTHFTYGRYSFYADGHYFEGLPPGGIDAFDLGSLAVRDASLVGRYGVDGDRVRLHAADGSVETLTRNADGSLTDGTTTSRPVQLPPDGARFDAEQETFSYSAVGAAFGNSGGSGRRGRLTLRPDGTFLGATVRGSSSVGPTHVGGGSRSRRVSGSYEVRGGELQLRAGGEVERRPIFWQQDDGGPSLWIGDKPAEHRGGGPPPDAATPAAPDAPREPGAAARRLALDLPAGATVRFTREARMRLDLTTPAGGRPVPVSGTITDTSAGTATVEAADAGRPTRLTLSFDPGLATVAELAGSRRRTPSALAGSTAAVTLTPDGGVASVEPPVRDPADLGQVRSAARLGGGLLPPASALPVAPGDAWPLRGGDLLGEGFAFGGGARVELLGFGEHAGRPAAELRLSGRVEGVAEPLRLAGPVGGTAWVDLASGVLLLATLTGELEASPAGGPGTPQLRGTVALEAQLRGEPGP